jgi:pimeloyl-ACP methyl ester carboxylesterase
MFNRYGKKKCTPAIRKKFLIGKQFNTNYLQVSEDDAIHNLKFFSLADLRRNQRGWGGVSWSDYGGLLEELQNYNWNKPVSSEDKDKKKEAQGKCFEFPVHAFGYNWTDSNLTSGAKLAGKIDKIIKSYKKEGRLCKYVILVTHSMGGLVARSACMLHNAESQVLGVIHGVQPVTGAAAGYWRMKAGFERSGGLAAVSSSVAAWVLGTNGEEVTCVLGNAPGGLELLPTKDYTANDGSKQWLHVTLKDGKKLSLPRYDPYEEIYRIGEYKNMVTKKRDAVFWRLINPEWLDPEDSGAKRRKSNLTDPWYEYNRCLGKAEEFHKKLKTQFHKNTYQFYSSGLKTVDKVTFTHEELTYHTHYEYDGLSSGYQYTEPSRQASSRGKCLLYADTYDQEIPFPLSKPHKTFVACMSDIGDYREGGDGTVPESSGAALKENNGSKILWVSRLKELAHQDVYKKRKGRDFVITAIRNLALKRVEEGIKEGGVGTAK